MYSTSYTTSEIWLWNVHRNRSFRLSDVAEFEVKKTIKKGGDNYLYAILYNDRGKECLMESKDLNEVYTEYNRIWSV